MGLSQKLPRRPPPPMPNQGSTRIALSDGDCGADVDACPWPTTSDTIATTAPAPAAANATSDTVASILAESRLESEEGPHTLLAHAELREDVLDSDRPPVTDPAMTPAPASPMPIQVKAVGEWDRGMASSGASGLWVRAPSARRFLASRSKRA